MDKAFSDVIRGRWFFLRAAFVGDVLGEPVDLNYRYREITSDVTQFELDCIRWLEAPDSPRTVLRLKTNPGRPGVTTAAEVQSVDDLPTDPSAIPLPRGRSPHASAPGA